MVDEITTNLVSVLLFGSVQGAVFSLLALGFSLVYGVGGILNLAHGGFYLACMYTFYWSVKVWEITFTASLIITLVVIVLIGELVLLLMMKFLDYNFVTSIIFSLGAMVGAGFLLLFFQGIDYVLTASIIITLLVITVISILIFFLLIKPLQDSAIGVLLVTFSFAFFLEQLVRVLPWSDSQTHWVPPIVEEPIELFGIAFSFRYVVAIVGSLILVVTIYLFINKSRLGKSIRAVAQDREAAQLMGINADMIILLTIIISGILAAMATFLYGAGEEVTPTMGWGFLTTSFAIVVLGGLGSIPGSILGAYLIGYARVFCSYFIGTQFAEIFPIIVIIIMLLFRPQGLLGKKEVE
jgi:branched-chain amino acid transport system permease protein